MTRRKERRLRRLSNLARRRHLHLFGEDRRWWTEEHFDCVGCNDQFPQWAEAWGSRNPRGLVRRELCDARRRRDSRV
jgi:hypothetical protein